MTYRLILSLIAAGKTAGLKDKVDVLYLAGRLTSEQYQDIMERLSDA